MNTANLSLWSAVAKTNPENTKRVSIGSYSFTTIDAYSQIEKATEIFGVFGIDWGVKDEHFTILLNDLVLYTSVLWYNYSGKLGQLELHSCIQIAPETKNGKRVDDECIKKVATDALTKGLSKLGFNADVFLGMFDDNRYIESLKKQFANEKLQKEIESKKSEIKPPETKEKPPLRPVENNQPNNPSPNTDDSLTTMKKEVKHLLDDIYERQGVTEKIYNQYFEKIHDADVNHGLLLYYKKQISLIAELYLLIAKDRVTDDERRLFYRQILASKMPELITLEKQFKERMAA
jgi:hypothetical protein